MEMNLLTFGRELFDKQSETARSSPRLRINYNFHTASDHPSQRVLNAMEPESYCRPHRHPLPTKDETFFILRGTFGLLVFDEIGNVRRRAVLRAGGDLVGGNVPAGILHTLLCLETGSLFFEAKAEPYEPSTDKELAPWAPEEQSAEGRLYLGRLKQLLLG